MTSNSPPPQLSAQAVVTSSFSFEAAHYLPGHPGKCHDLHGHSYKIEVSVSGPISPNGMVVDFSDIERVVNEVIVKRWDHKLLNDTLENPTAENIAATALCLLHEAGLDASKIKLFETTDGWVEVYR